MRQIHLVFFSLIFVVQLINGELRAGFITIFSLNHNLIASPFERELSSSSRSRRNQNHQLEWKQPEDNWNITTIPRSILPHLENKNFTHSLPAPGNIQYKTIDNDEKLLERFHEIKVNEKPKKHIRLTSS